MKRWIIVNEGIDRTDNQDDTDSSCRGCEGSGRKTETENRGMGWTGERPKVKKRKAAQKAAVGRHNMWVGSA